MDAAGDEAQLEDSIASSIPTDLSISEISDLKVQPSLSTKKSSILKTKKQQQKEKDKISKQLLEKKQLEHDLQLVRIELNQKEYLLENLKTEYKMKIEDLEEKLTQYKQQKKFLIAKTESQLALQQDESKRKQERLQADLSVIKVKLRELESQNDKLTSKSLDVKQQLKEHVDVSEEVYYELRGSADEMLSVKDLVAMRIFEALRPYKIELDEVKVRCERLSTNLTESEDRANLLKQELEEERQQNSVTQIKLTRLITETQELEAKASSKDYRINNYDRINKERDDLEKQVTELKDRNTVLERDFTATARDKKHYEQEFSSTKSALTLINQDKDYLTRQVCELTNKLAYSEERLQRLTAEVDEVKRAREELFEKYVSSRDQYKTQYEQQLQAELKMMSASTQEEVEKLRSTTKAMYEMEARSLRESRDMAIAERDKALAQEADLQTKYHKLNDEYRQDKVNSDTQLSELRSQVKMAEYEKSRAQLLQEETSKSVKEFQVENEKLLKKLEVANKEYYSMEMRFSRKCSDSESKISEYQTRLQAYENIEKELDEVIMQAAEVDTDDGAEKVMLSYGYGASIPSSSQRRMKQSVHLARRCLALERQMVGDKRQIKVLESAVFNLKEELAGANEKLDTAEQPYSYILNKTKELEDSNRQLKKANHCMEKELKIAKEKCVEKSAEIQNLLRDMERSSCHLDEINMMKDQLRRVLSKRTLAKKERLLGEMSDKERIQRSRGLLADGGDSEKALLQAEQYLRPVNLPFNPATQVLSGERSLQDAISYLDTVILAQSPPSRLPSTATGRSLGKSLSHPIRSISEDLSGDQHQPAPISMNRKTVQKGRRPALKKH